MYNFGLMIKVYVQSVEIERDENTANLLYIMLLSLVAPETNRIELDGRPLNREDLYSYSNMTRCSFSRALNSLVNAGVLINVQTQRKDFYYMNPRFASDPDTPICLFDWMLDIINDEQNDELKTSLIYFPKRNRKISVQIGRAIDKLYGDDDE